MKPARLLMVSVLVLAAVLVAARAPAQDPAASRHADPAPGDLADPIEAVLAPGGPRVTVGSITLDFWLVKSLPLRSGTTDVNWSSVDEGTIVGVVKLSSGFKEIRGKTVKAGVYVLRYGVQPSDGNHLGVSPFREFLLLTPMAAESSVSAISNDDLIKLSKQTTTGHPAAWSLDPPVATAAALTAYKTESGHKGVVIEVPASRDGKDLGTLKFGLILVGTVTT